jgi:hypothetical protein
LFAFFLSSFRVVLCLRWTPMMMMMTIWPCMQSHGLFLCAADDDSCYFAIFNFIFNECMECAAI